MIDENTKPGPCPYCGLYHKAVCPRVKAMEYHQNGALKRVEFHEDHPLAGTIRVRAKAELLESLSEGHSSNG